MDPIPAATDVHRRLISPSELTQFIPQARNLIATDEAFHEYLGIGWAAIRQQLKERSDARKARLEEHPEHRDHPADSRSQPLHRELVRAEVPEVL